MSDQEDLFAASDGEEEEQEAFEKGIAKSQRSRQSLEGIFFGAFKLEDYLGRGRGGGTVFIVSQVGHPGRRAAAKWPVSAAEVDVLQDLNAKPSCLGVPKLLARGMVDDEWYMVTERLGRPMSKIFKAIRRFPLRFRWEIVSILGRMVLLRLEGMHQKGYIHNDVKPDNILIGRSGGKGIEQHLPFLIDFGTTQRFSGNDKLRRDLGTVDFNSVRSGQDLQRRPHDDLEALGWTMLHGLFGKLPWFHLTRQAKWSDMSQRFEAVSQVQAMKGRVLKEGFGFLGHEWSHLEKTPEGLWRFLQLCQPTKYLKHEPPYADLARALGSIRYGEPSADQQDVAQLCNAAREGRQRQLQVDYADGEAEAWKEQEELRYAAMQAKNKEATRQADEERMRDMIVWQVVGGEERGGVLVRKGIELTSPALSTRLATGALVEQEVLEGERLSYNRLLGDGPNCGWISLRIKYGEVVKELVVPHSLTYEELELIKDEEVKAVSA